MRKYFITVEGTTYEVGVEEAGTTSDAPQQVNVPAASQAQAYAIKSVPQDVPVEKPAPAPKTAPLAAQGGETIFAPMPGKIVSLAVKAGDTVEPNSLILVLEAMKMENEVFCEKGGKIVEIKVNEGSSVNANDVLVVIG